MYKIRGPSPLRPPGLCAAIARSDAHPNAAIAGFEASIPSPPPWEAADARVPGAFSPELRLG